MKESIYHKYHDAPYVGKHEKKWYNVHRVLGPGGPSETVAIFGLEEAKNSVKDIYGCKIVDPNGRTVYET